MTEDLPEKFYYERTMAKRLVREALNAIDYIQCTNGGGTARGICGECAACMAYGRLRVAIEAVDR